MHCYVFWDLFTQPLSIFSRPLLLSHPLDHADTWCQAPFTQRDGDKPVTPVPRQRSLADTEEQQEKASIPWETESPAQAQPTWGLPLLLRTWAQEVAMSLPVALYEISQKATLRYQSLFMVMEAQCHKASTNMSQ